MTKSLLAKLDELQVQVSALTKALEQTRHENKVAKEQVATLRRDNQTLQKKLNQTQEQVDQILSQWFPELELNMEK